MSMAVLISIQPKWVKLIDQGKKTIEVRKTVPKIETPFKCYIYCTKDKSERYILRGDDDAPFVVGNGYVVGEFICDKIIDIRSRGISDNFDYCYLPLTVFGNDDIEPEIRAISKSCIPKMELNAYGAGHTIIYAWQISRLRIYTNPKSIKDFKCRALTWRGNNHIHAFEEMKRPPQSWCYVEELQ